MPTPGQLRTIHNGARTVGLIEPGGNDARYRMLLANVGGVSSTKLLDNAGVEDVMAVIEGMGFTGHPAGPTYWQDTVRRRGTHCGARAIHKINELAAGQRYELPALCEMMSKGRTDAPENLTPYEAWKLIEGLKAIRDRERI